MDGLGNPQLPVTDDELRQVFEAVAAGKPVMQSPLRRHRTTVYKIHNVVSQFQLRDLTTCDDREAADIAEKAQYGATLGYVHALFLRWKAWKGSDSAHGNKTREGRPDPELGPHRRELFYLGRRLRDLASVPLPYEVARATEEKGKAGMWSPWPSGVAVARNIAAGEMVAGRSCAVLFFDAANPQDAVVLAAYG
jgi:hypothetical protein